MFSHSVFESLRLSSTDGFHYLFSLVYGDVEVAVAGIRITESPYSDSLDALKIVLET